MMPTTMTHGAEDGRAPEQGDGASASRAQPRRRGHDGTRTCVGCGRRVSPEQRDELIRLSLLRDTERVAVVADLRRSAGGRGAWVHATWPCLRQAAKKGLSRSAKARVQADPEVLGQQIGAQAARRVEGLLASARRAGVLAAGGDAVREMIARSPEALVMVAGDARAAAQRPEVQRHLHRMVWGTKATLGDVTAKAEVGVVAVEDVGLAEALRRAISLAATFGSGPEKEGAAAGPRPAGN